MVVQVVTILVVAVAVSMDAFAVSVATGAAYRKLGRGYVIRMAFFFGLFQALMPLAGHFAGVCFMDAISAYDHWVAFVLLSVIGVKMVFDAGKHGREEHPNPAGLGVLIMLSVATSIDALAVGVTLSLITSNIFSAVIMIGLITYLFSYAGCRIGQKVGHIFENRIEAAAGLTLIAIGVKILLMK